LTPDQQRCLDYDLEGTGPTETALALNRDRKTIATWRRQPQYMLALAEESAPMLETVGPLARRAAARLAELMESTDDKTAHVAAKALFDAGLKHEDIRTGAPQATYIDVTFVDGFSQAARLDVSNDRDDEGVSCRMCGGHVPAGADYPLLPPDPLRGRQGHFHADGPYAALPLAGSSLDEIVSTSADRPANAPVI
jgi:hypothetical protein